MKNKEIILDSDFIENKKNKFKMFKVGTIGLLLGKGKTKEMVFALVIWISGVYLIWAMIKIISLIFKNYYLT